MIPLAKNLELVGIASYLSEDLIEIECVRLAYNARYICFRCATDEYNRGGRIGRILPDLSVPIHSQLIPRTFALRDAYTDAYERKRLYSGRVLFAYAAYVTVDCQPLFPRSLSRSRTHVRARITHKRDTVVHRDSLHSHRPMHTGERTCLLSHDNNDGDNCPPSVRAPRVNGGRKKWSDETGAFFAFRD